MSILQFSFFFAFVTFVSAQYLLDPYVAPVYTAPYYSAYVYGGNRGNDQSKSVDGSAEKPPMGFIPNPLDPANGGNRQFPPMMPNQNQQQQQFQNGPPMFPSPIMPINAENMQSTTTEAPAKSKL